MKTAYTLGFGLLSSRPEERLLQHGRLITFDKHLLITYRNPKHCFNEMVYKAIQPQLV